MSIRGPFLFGLGKSHGCPNESETSLNDVDKIYLGHPRKNHNTDEPCAYFMMTLSQRPVTRRFDGIFDLRLNKRLSKQS